MNNTMAPYFDNLTDRFKNGDTEALSAFGRHIHWGYWPEPKKADGTLQDFVQATENLSRRVCDSANIEDGMSILDAGCGFGGTISHLNERFSKLNLVGINIAQEQVNRAQEVVKPRANNLIEFVHGDACRLPFADNSFDVVLALECIFAFPSRLNFFEEANRVLHPGGRLVICDFLPIEAIGNVWNWYEKLLKPLVGQTYGKYSINFCTLSEYKKIADSTLFKIKLVEDITKNTLPTYPVVNPIMCREGNTETYWSTKGLQFISQINILKYMILSLKSKR